MRRGWVFLSVALAVLSAPTYGTAAGSKEPLHVELFVHGETSVGEAHFPNALGGSYMTMDRKRPISEVPKSIGFTNVGGAAPNPDCAGSPYFPVWVGEVGGHIEGDVIFEFFVVSSPGGKVEVRVWPDMSTFGCNEDYRVPSAKSVVELPVGSGKVTALMRGANFESAANVMVQVTPLMPGVGQGRILYDAASAPTSLSFDCTPLWGDTCEAYQDREKPGP